MERLEDLPWRVRYLSYDWEQPREEKVSKATFSAIFYDYRVRDGMFEIISIDEDGVPRPDHPPDFAVPLHRLIDVHRA